MGKRRRKKLIPKRGKHKRFRMFSTASVNAGKTNPIHKIGSRYQGRGSGVVDPRFMQAYYDRVSTVVKGVTVTNFGSDLPPRLYLKHTLQHMKMAGYEPDPRLEVLVRLRELIQGLEPQHRILLEETKEQRIWMFFEPSKTKALLVRFIIRTKTFQRSIVYPSNEHAKRMYLEFKKNGRTIPWVESVSAQEQ